MKKFFTLMVAALLVSGASYACEGKSCGKDAKEKACCKKGDKCSKDSKEKKAVKDTKKTKETKPTTVKA